MTWVESSNPAGIPAGTSVKAVAGENVIYGTWQPHGSASWGTVKFPTVPSEDLVLFLKSWTIYTEVYSFWDAMEDAEIGTTAQRKETDSVYVKLETRIVNALTLNTVDKYSPVAKSLAKDFNWTEPKAFFPQY